MQLLAQRLAEAHDRVLGGAVRRAAGEAELARRRCDVDKVAAPAAREALERELRAEDHAVQVDVDHPLGAGVRLVDERADGHDAGVVDQDVERPEPVLDLVEKRAEAGAVGDVERQPNRPVAELVGGPLGQR